MNPNEFTIITAIVILIANIGVLITTCLVWRGCMKMYTEYFKDVSARNRKY